jgi:peptidoglycan hydrolase-like protein with peptidoglycan-binding domain
VAGPDVAEPAPPDADAPPAGRQTAKPEAPAPSGEPAAAEAPDPVRAAAAAEEKLGLGRDQRREVQARLLVAGHDPRGLDGIFGPGTRLALSAWQAAQGLERTGYLDAAALDLLERRTESAYAVWVERQRAEEAARRAAARAERRAARAALRPDPAEPRAAAPEAARTRAAPEATPPAEAPTLAAPGPEIGRPNPLATPRNGGSHRERYQQKCYFVTTGTPELKRICN